MDPAFAHETNLPRILGVLTTFHFIALTFVALRLYARLFVVKAFGKDDACICVSALCALGGWIAFVIQGYNGLGRHLIVMVSDPVMTKNFYHASFWQSIISAITALGFLKLSIGFGLLRLSTHRWYNLAIWVTMGIVVAYSIMAWFTFFLQCNPMAAYWDASLIPDPVNDPKCYPITLFIKFGLINTSFNIATDILFAAFPIPIILGLQMKTRTKMYLVLVLSLGYFAVGFGIAKAVYQIAFGGERDRWFEANVTFYGLQVTCPLFCPNNPTNRFSLQLNFGIIAACAATLKPLLNNILKLGSTHRSGTKGTGPSSLHTWGSRSFGQRQNGHERLDTPSASRSRKDDLDTISNDNDYELEHGKPRARDSEMYPVMGTQGGAPLYPGNGVTVQSGRGAYKGDDASSSEMILGQGKPGKKGIVVATEFGVKS
ncbi:hypothetical protein B0T14DRAFT_437370 [Immersiella caudata]|uniref:Rhodopsin domain-containing protein n=1 Tax=Immersiella caudata TaxID=314043 RepID=A0AA39WFC6_9PEZI|nr:hypothetical protein B0T14DRAFT_437370 [Immersiella caudata]